MRVTVEVEEGYVCTDIGEGHGLTVTCDRCGYYVEVLGVGEPSERAACALLRAGCPNNESNWYALPPLWVGEFPDETYWQ
jgi:tRNA G26 N,N-dimethylase Trm1